MCYFFPKVEKIYKYSMDSIPSPSPSVKIQTIDGKVFLRESGKTLLGDVNKLLRTKSENYGWDLAWLWGGKMTDDSTSNFLMSKVLSLQLKQTLPTIISIFTEGEGDGI